MYDYAKEKAALFTDEGQRTFLSIRDRVQRLLREAGAIRLEEATRGEIGSSWTMLACVDRLVELGELREVLQNKVAGQNRFFVATGS